MEVLSMESAFTPEQPSSDHVNRPQNPIRARLSITLVDYWDHFSFLGGRGRVHDFEYEQRLVHAFTKRKLKWSEINRPLVLF